MGYYINKNSKGVPLSPTRKTAQLLLDGAELTDASFKENLVCVVENGLFDAAAYCYSEEEFRIFNMNDGRRRNWLIHPMAKQLSGYIL